MARLRLRRAQTFYSPCRSPPSHTARHKVGASRGPLFGLNHQVKNLIFRLPPPLGAPAQSFLRGRGSSHPPPKPPPNRFCQCLQGQCQMSHRALEFAANIQFGAAYGHANRHAWSSAQACCCSHLQASVYRLLLSQVECLPARVVFWHAHKNFRSSARPCAHCPFCR